MLSARRLIPDAPNQADRGPYMAALTTAERVLPQIEGIEGIRRQIYNLLVDRRSSAASPKSSVVRPQGFLSAKEASESYDIPYEPMARESRAGRASHWTLVRPVESGKPPKGRTN